MKSCSGFFWLSIEYFLHPYFVAFSNKLSSKMFLKMKFVPYPSQEVPHGMGRTICNVPPNISHHILLKNFFHYHLLFPLPSQYHPQIGNATPPTFVPPQTLLWAYYIIAKAKVNPIGIEVNKAK
jgi:hypothetical protein